MPAIEPNVTEATRLRDLFDRHATLSQAAFGREWGLGTGSMVYQYLSARRPLNLRAAVRFAAGLGVELSAISPRLAAELQEALQLLPAATRAAGQAEYARVRCVTLKLQANKRRYGQEPLEGVGEYIAFRHDWLKERGYQSQHLLAIRVGDDGMQPTLWKSDLVVIHTTEVEAADSAVFAINYEGELRIRRVIRDAGEWWLYCDNPDSHRFPRRKLVEKRCFMLGRVVHRQSESL